MSRGGGLNRTAGVDVEGMNHDELAWQEVLFKGFEVLVTAAVHGACGMGMRLSVHGDSSTLVRPPPAGSAIR
ncbi:hypothetical protein, partial [Streptomyces sp. NPDC005485]|uniref:hypothetical protein n=1 Tax=Streptomyces sp. NPDC005485 TaxID=3155591 RepID=UPI0033B03B8E